MTIEIRELVIRAVAEARPADGHAGHAAGHAATATPLPSLEPAHLADTLALDREALVARVVREVLRELQKTRGR